MIHESLLEMSQSYEHVHTEVKNFDLKSFVFMSVNMIESCYTGDIRMEAVSLTLPQFSFTDRFA